jgi:hypothetical protein
MLFSQPDAKTKSEKEIIRRLVERQPEMDGAIPLIQRAYFAREFRTSCKLPGHGSLSLTSAPAHVLRARRRPDKDSDYCPLD